MLVTRKELIRRISSITRLPQWEVDMVLRAFVVAIRECISAGNEVRIYGLGLFKLQYHKGWMYKNKRIMKRTEGGGMVEVARRDTWISPFVVPFLKFAPMFKDAVRAAWKRQEAEKEEKDEAD